MNVEDLIKDKTILVTGGTGSFGYAVTKRLLTMNPKKVVIFSRDEKKQADMRHTFDSPALRFVVGDIRDKQAVDHVMHGIDYVFHAAGLKSVPNCEFIPLEAIKTNVLGAHNVIYSAIEHHVKKVIILSTDKAVYPINVMGQTKALMERIMIAASREKRNETVVCGIRYGNMLCSRGSVVPTFIDLIRARKPITVTNKAMTRFLMSMEDSVGLIFYAFLHGESGALYVQKAPASTIGDLAQALVEIFGYNGTIQEVGPRPGEKIHESLVSFEESFRADDVGVYYKIAPEFPDIDDERYAVWIEKNNGLRGTGFTSSNTQRLSVAEVKRLLLSLDEIQAALKGSAL